jgi:hypothetical protein
MESAWAIRVAYDDMVSSTNRLIPWPRPPEHKQLCEDNRKGTVPYTKLILCGTVDSRFYAKGSSLWEKRQRLKDKAVWHLEFGVNPTDLVIYMLGFIGIGFTGLSLADLHNNK